MEREKLDALIEAVLLTARGSVASDAVAQATENEVKAAEVEEAMERIRADWEAAERGVRLERAAGGWRCVTPPALDSFLRSYHGIAARQRLSQAALEVLAIVAHRQPVTLPELNFIRGANSASVVRTLLERKLLRMAGRKKVVGKPFLYRTSKEFLVHFGLERPEDLPDPEEMVSLVVLCVKAQFVANKEEDQYTDGHSQCQPQNVDERISLMSSNNPQCDLKIIFKHVHTPTDGIFAIGRDQFCDMPQVPGLGFGSTRLPGLILVSLLKITQERLLIIIVHHLL